MIWDVRCNKRDGYYQPVNTIHNCHSTTPSGTLQRSNKKRRRRSSAIVGQVKSQNVTWSMLIAPQSNALEMSVSHI